MTGDARTSYLHRRTWLEAGVAAAIGFALSLIVFAPIMSSLDSPLGGGDMLATYVNADNWNGVAYGVTTHYGFPFGMNLNYSPNLDITENTFARVVDAVSGSPFLGINLLLLLSFPLVAGLSYLTLRLVCRGGPLAIALSVAFTMIPFHFGRGLGHTYLATMYGCVAAVALAIVIASGAVPNVIAQVRHRSPDLRWRPLLPLVLLTGLVVLTAWSGLYYAAFGVILGVAALVWRIGAGDGWRRLCVSATPVASVVALAIVGFLPGLLTYLNAPPTTPLAERSAAESVTLAGSLAMALLPAPISQLGPLSRYNAAVNDAVNSAAPSPAVESTALTNYGTWVTTAALIVFIVGWVVRARRRSLADSRVALVGYFTGVATLFFVPWGLNFLAASAVTAQVRAWNRLVPVLLLLFLLGAMAALSRTRWDRFAPATIAVGLVILVVVAVEQVAPFRTAYREGAANGVQSLATARAYAADVNEAIPDRCGILQLPYAQYPEQGVIAPELEDYAHFLQPLANPYKDYSYGAVKNTAASSKVATIALAPRPDEVEFLRANGFCAIHVDRRGIPDDQWDFVRLDLEAAFGPPVATGDNGTWLTYDIRRA